jgi:hypothetical protein
MTFQANDYLPSKETEIDVSKKEAQNFTYPF